MKKNLYPRVGSVLLLAHFYFIPNLSFSQTCSNLHATYTTTESRCMATGTITVQATGGSGNYNYKASGPVTTSFTSSKIITGLQAGTYKVIVRDITGNCQVEIDSIKVSGSYSDPRFLLSGTDVTCAGNDGSITAGSQQFGRSPFTYTIVAPSPAGVGTTNATGQFTNLIAGEYAIQLKDSCGGIQVRRITLQDYSWWFDGVVVTKTDCNTADAEIHLKDNKGNLNTSAGNFSGFQYGVVNAPGDTTWSATPAFTFSTGSKLTVTFVAKDPCGTIHSYMWAVPANAKPSVDAIAISNKTCTGFTAATSGEQNLTNPEYKLFDGSNTEIASNTTGIFNNLSYGSYCMQIKDACYDTTIIKCFTAAAPTPSVASAVSISNRTCNNFTASITGQQGLFSAMFCLYDASNNQLACNSTGVFDNLAYGDYCIKITDGCTNTQLDRCFTAAKLAPVLHAPTLSGQSCTGLNVNASGDNLINPEFCLYDSLGNVITCNNTGVFTGIPNGNYCIRAVSCGDTTQAVCFSGTAPTPAVGPSVQISNKACSNFTASITGQVNLTTPQYCLYDSLDVQIVCNNTGVFDSLAYGRYCIKITDGCYDTTIVRCFTQYKPMPSVSATMQQQNNTCTTFTAKVTGQKNLFNPQYCIYDAADNQLSCNSTGVFNNLPYGSYCVVETDGCTGATLRICQTFNYQYNINVAAGKSCTIGNTDIAVSFVKGASPFTVDVFDPLDSLVYTTTATATTHVDMPGLDSGKLYKIIGTDACGKKDSATVVPDASRVGKQIVAVGKCPSAAWLDGSGDLKVTAASNLGTVTPKIISKNGTTFSKTHSSNSDSLYIFSDLEPASYVVQYSIQNCSNKLYDTFALQPYAYPTQGRSSIYQCDNKSISLTADVSGGVGPFSYQIIGSEPETPSIVSADQSNPTFNINTGTTYSLIRLRTVDACGNATLNDVSVLPLQNILITADTTCLFTNITLSVDTIQEATYSWYKKLGSNDSMFLTSDKIYNIPMMQQQDIGTYICKVELNNSCLTRLASFNLTGDCGETFLPVAIPLSARPEKEGTTLSWMVTESRAVLYYEITRKRNGNSIVIGRVGAAAPNGMFQFTDTSGQQGVVKYQVKAVMQNGAAQYSNEVSITRTLTSNTIYPNPAHDDVTVYIQTPGGCNYRLGLYSMNGRLLYERTLKNLTQSNQHLRRPSGVPHGLYLLKIENETTGAVQFHKLLFE